ncbi:MAG: VWA domain-containing protein [Treponema sp.]|nr:VWA domain-containing protein [Candidatus Treponema caballi]
MKKHFTVICLVLLVPVFMFAGGRKDSATSSDRAMYLAQQGQITPASEIEIDAYLSQLDYDYPLPVGEPVNFIMDADRKDELAYLQLGLKAQKTDFSDLPQFNLAFVIDCSGSMSSLNKMSWVKDSFEIFIEKVRPTDYVSLIAFSSNATVVFPATQMKGYVEKQKFRDEVQRMMAYGGTNIYDGLAAGYQEVVANFNPLYNNRVILLTDGEDGGAHTRNEILNLADRYNSQEINVSCIALGTSADVNLMNDIAEKGGGSSRFISNHEKMVETFSTELDRLIVPAARDLTMTLTLADGVTLINTWGYDYTVDGQNITYTLNTIHNGDYETIVTEMVLPEGFMLDQPVAWLSYDYRGMTGTKYEEKAIPAYFYRKQAFRLVKRSEAQKALLADNRQDDIENPRVLHSEAYIRFARFLQDIAGRNDSIIELQKQFIALKNKNPEAMINGDIVSDSSDQAEELAAAYNEIVYQLNDCIKRIDAMRADLVRIDGILPGDQFVKDFQILDNYKATFTRSLDNYLNAQNQIPANQNSAS